MLDHLELAVTNLDRSQEFYRTALAPLNYALRVSTAVRGFGSDMDSLDFWLKAGIVSTPQPHFAFRCATRKLVDASYDAAIGAGGTPNGAPQLLARIHPHYYAGFVLDPDGHNVEFVCQKPEG